MKTPERTRIGESARKARKKKENLVRLRELKQLLYYSRTGRWENDPLNLHFHHVDPSTKTRKLSHLSTRSWERIEQELQHCVVVNSAEHLKLHSLSVLRRGK